MRLVPARMMGDKFRHGAAEVTTQVYTYSELKVTSWALVAASAIVALKLPLIGLLNMVW